MPKYLICISSLFFCLSAWCGEVRTVCEKTGVPVIDLEYRNRTFNERRIVQENSKGSLIAFIKKANLSKETVSQEMESFAQESNRKLQTRLPQKETFLRYSTEKQKRSDPEGYRAAVLSSIKELIPEEAEYLNHFLSTKSPKIESSSFRPANGQETGEMYGAIFKSEPLKNEKYKLEIIFSNNASEPLPYLLTLIAHELQHAESFFDKIRIQDAKKQVEFRLLDEAKAFDRQMKTYLSLIRKDPNLFCNWIYVSWAYGDLVVPLSWVMSSMEAEMMNGTFMIRYATQGTFAGETQLLNSKKTDLHPDVRKAISDLKLRYVK